MPKHPDFEKIYQAFIKRYGQVEGEKNYYAWLSKMGLDDTKSYARPQESLCKDAFTWAQYMLSYLREDETKKYFKVEASFPLSSMNNVVYTEDELKLGARSLIGKPVNLNHDGKALGSVSIEGAEYEDGAVECVLGFLKGSDVLGMVEKGEIVHVSTEANCSQGVEDTADGSVCMGLVYTGLALLTKEVLPGVPLTRIIPVESIVESFQVMVNGGENVSENDKGKTEDKVAPAEKVEKKVEEKKSPCEEAHEALLVRFGVLEGKVKLFEDAKAKEQKEFEEKAVAEKKAAEAKRSERPSVLTKEGFWARFHELRKEGANKSDAFRLVSMEVIEASSKP
jgi:hypothetical protein